MRLHAQPFALGDGPDACLVLHGLTGTPAEVRPVGEALAASGFRAVGPLLPGHGTTPDELFAVTRADMIRAAREALSSLRGARKIFVCGLSMGALLSIELASQSWQAEGLPEISAVALMAPAVKFEGTTRIFTEVLGRLPALPVLIPKGRRDIQRGETEPSAYDRVPMCWGRELRLLSNEAMTLAPRVRAPALVLHGALDKTASLSGAKLLVRTLGSTKLRELEVLQLSGHVLPLDVQSAEVCGEIVRFFQGT
jgi:carboxylesterase